MRRDLLWHFCAGLAVSAWVGSLLGPGIGILAGMTAGAMKEWLWDVELKHGVGDWRDLAATTAGAILAGIAIVGQ